MKTYELLTIFKPNLDAEEAEKLVSKISDTVAEFGGKVNSTDKIGRKKLAFDIQGFRDGFFTSFEMTLPADKVAESVSISYIYLQFTVYCIIKIMNHFT